MEDLRAYHAFRSDPAAIDVAVFSTMPSGLPAFTAGWITRLRNPEFLVRTVLVDGEIAGDVASFQQDDTPSIAYWIGREFWGRGVATEAVRQLIALIEERPLYARIAVDNVGSQRVVERNGFVHVDDGTHRSEHRGEDVAERVYRLD